MMEIPRAIDLVFNEIEDEKAPHFYCNSCGKKHPGKGMLMCDIPFGHDMHYSFVVCNHTCEKEFKQHKGVDHFIRSRINEARRQYRNWAIKQQHTK